MRPESLCKGCGGYRWRHDWSCLTCDVVKPKPVVAKVRAKRMNAAQRREAEAYYKQKGK